MAWHTLTSYSPSTYLTYGIVNGIGLDLRTWGDNVDAGGYGLANAAFATLVPAALPGSPTNGMLAITTGNVLQQYFSGAWRGVLGAVTANAPTNVVLTTTLADISVSHTVARTGNYIAIGAVYFFVQGAGDALQTLTGALLVNGVNQNLLAVCAGPDTAQVTAAQSWVFTATVGQVVKLQAKKVAGSGTSFVGVHSTLTLIGPF